jgi:hypothetical protein
MKSLSVASIATLLLLPLLINCGTSVGGDSQEDISPDAATSNPPGSTDPNCEPGDDVCTTPEENPDPDPSDPDPTDPDPTDPDPIDPDPGTVEVPLFIVGDCVTAACPAATPYPVGCNVIFSPGDDRGCVASSPTESIVYFQAGDKCNQGLILGTLYCSATVGAALDFASCPINKPVPMHVSSSNQCPETND